MGWLGARLSEPSTYAAVAGLLGLTGAHMTPEQYHWLVETVGSLAAVGGIVLSEKK